MTELRKDLFPNMVDSPFWPRQEHLNTTVNNLYLAFGTHFEDKDKLIEFINGLDSRETVEFFIDIGEYLFLTSNTELERIKLIMLFSLIEKLASQYVPFPSWLEMKDNKTLQELLEQFVKNEDFSNKKQHELLKQVSGAYQSKHGATNAVKNFLKKHLSKEEKQWLISCFNTKNQKFITRYSPLVNLPTETIEEMNEFYPIDEGLLPRCYDWKQCRIEYGGCWDTSCKLLKTEETLNTELNYIVSIMYSFRSAFVHEATIPPIHNGIILGLYKNKPIRIKLDFDKFQKLIERSILEHFK